MHSRREFLQRALVGAGALAIAGCGGGDDEPPALEGVQQLKYGESPAQLGELLVPNTFGPYPVVVLIHGGWWRQGWDRRAGRDLARDLVKKGYATWNLEYRLVGNDGGGWPGTFEDIAAGVDALTEHADDYNLDLSKLVFLGHSAGGQLALWAAARGTFQPGTVGASPRLLPNTVVAQAPVTDLVLAAHQNLGDGAVQALLGGTPEAEPSTYLMASPVELLPITPPQYLVHAIDDQIVPFEQSRIFVDASRKAGGDVEFEEIPAGGHFWLIDVNGDAWKTVRGRLDEFVERPAITPPTTVPR